MKLFNKSKEILLPKNVIKFHTNMEYINYLNNHGIIPLKFLNKIKNTQALYDNMKPGDIVLYNNLLYRAKTGTEFVDYTYNSSKMVSIITSYYLDTIRIETEISESYIRNSYSMYYSDHSLSSQYGLPYTLVDGNLILKEGDSILTVSNFKLEERIEQTELKTVKIPISGVSLEQIGRYYLEETTMVLDDGIILQ